MRTGNVANLSKSHELYCECGITLKTFPPRLCSAVCIHPRRSNNLADGEEGRYNQFDDSNLISPALASPGHAYSLKYFSFYAMQNSPGVTWHGKWDIRSGAWRYPAGTELITPPRHHRHHVLLSLPIIITHVFSYHTLATCVTSSAAISANK